jgi:hypothetical protein
MKYTIRKMMKNQKFTILLFIKFYKKLMKYTIRKMMKNQEFTILLFIKFYKKLMKYTIRKMMKEKLRIYRTTFYKIL